MRVNNLTAKITPSTFDRQNIYLSIIFVANIVFLLLCLYLIPQMPERIPLWYAAASGEGQLAKSSQLVIAPFLSILFLVLNQIIIAIKKEAYASSLLLGASALFLTMCLISVIRVATLVGPW
jgi:hypothetical protein